MSTKSSLKFDQFQNVTVQARTKMRNNEFCDVTLVSADNKKLGAHKVILAASSSFFQNMLQSENHCHPVIFMSGAKHEVLDSMVEFIYTGETKLSNNNIDSFVKLITSIELFGVNEEALKRECDKRKENMSTKRKPCKYWNSGFCKDTNCHNIHIHEDCEDHLDGYKCRRKSCQKRHRKTCRYWYTDGCDRNKQCSYLHQYTYGSRRTYSSECRNQSFTYRGRSYSRVRYSRSRDKTEERSVTRRGSRSESQNESRSRSRIHSRSGSREQSRSP